MTFEGRQAPSDRTEQAAADLIKKALEIIDREYGPESESPKAYHNADHTRAVIEAVSELAELAISRGKLDPRDQHLLLIAAAWHDVHHQPGADNELVSADMAVRTMKESGAFNKEDRHRVENMIMATQVHQVEGRIAQSATPDDYATQLLADADVANLGWDFEDYWAATSRLYSERYQSQTAGPAEIATFGIGFLRQHKFYTQEAEDLFPNQEDNVEKLEMVLGI